MLTAGGDELNVGDNDNALSDVAGGGGEGTWMTWNERALNRTRDKVAKSWVLLEIAGYQGAQEHL